ncbi:unnamed protein product [Closterium sp. NIES-64]|nr:unnamed protein product [Closterium sp. NIES-64]
MTDGGGQTDGDRRRGTDGWNKTEVDRRRGTNEARQTDGNEKEVGQTEGDSGKKDGRGQTEGDRRRGADGGGRRRGGADGGGRRRGADGGRQTEEAGGGGIWRWPDEFVDGEGVNLQALCVGVKVANAYNMAVQKQRIRIKLKSYQVPQLEAASEQILEVAKETGAGIMGPVRLPTHIRKYCVLRSPHVDKDSREHFEIRTHKRLIDLENPTATTIDALMQLELPYGVEVDVKLS